MNRVHQLYKTYEPAMEEFYATSSSGIGNAMLNTKYNKVTELVGFYKHYKENKDYFLDDKRVVLISPKVLNEEKMIFDFESSFDIPIGSKIEINGQEYAINNKKYQLNGDVDYFIEDKYIKSIDYEEKYTKVKMQAEEHLFNQQKLESEYEMKNPKEFEEKKSFWWYLGIR